MSNGLTQARRGPRPGGVDTRAALLDAAREVFAERGYQGATMRAIAARADVDAAMVNHWFGSKEGLFAEAVMDIPFDLDGLVRRLLDGDVGRLGERIVRTFLTNCDTAGGGVFAALLRSGADPGPGGHHLHDFVITSILAPVLRAVGVDQPDFRAMLVTTQVVGIGVVRYVARFDQFAAADVDRIVTAVAPAIQRYITGDIA
nr:TetR family transcriptional regulator [Actinoplanes globisporus]